MASWRRLRAHAVLLASSMAGQVGANSCHVRWGTRFVASCMYPSTKYTCTRGRWDRCAPVKGAATNLPRPGPVSDLLLVVACAHQGTSMYLAMLCLVPQCRVQCRWSNCPHGTLQDRARTSSCRGHEFPILPIFRRARAEDRRRAYAAPKSSCSSFLLVPPGSSTVRDPAPATAHLSL